DAESPHAEPGKSTIAELRQVIIVFKLLFSEFIAFKALGTFEEEARFGSGGKFQPPQTAVVLAAPLKGKRQPQVGGGELVFVVIDFIAANHIPRQRRRIFAEVDVLAQPDIGPV